MMKKIIYSFFTNHIVESIILTILPLAYGITYPLSLNEGWENKDEKLFNISVILTLVDFIVAIIYISYEIKKEKSLERSIKQGKNIHALIEAYKNIDSIVKDLSLHLYDIINKSTTHSYIDDWRLIQEKGNLICIALLKLVKETSCTGNDFSVSIFFKQRIQEEGNYKNGYTMVARASDHHSDNPKAYHNFIPEQVAEGMYYKKVFDSSPTKAQILHSKRVINAEFKDASSRDFSQYIALPIKCKSNIVAVLQIVAYGDSKVGKNKKEITQLCDDYFSIFANLVLLIDKIENVTQE